MQPNIHMLVLYDLSIDAYNLKFVAAIPIIIYFSRSRLYLPKNRK